MKKVRMIGSAVVVGGLMLSAGCGTPRVQEEPVGPVVMPPTTEVVTPVEIKPEPKVEAVVESKSYVVKPGDSLGSIAKRFKVSTKDIVKLNNISNPNKIRVNQKLKLPGSVELSAADAAPAPVSKTVHKKPVKKPVKAVPVEASGDVYTVKSGDMLGSIAVAHKTTARAIKQLNGLSSDKLQVGQKLKMPKGSAAPVKESTPATPVEEAGAPAEAAPVAPVTEGALPPKSNDVLHVVELNQDLNSIAMMYGVRAEEVMRLNNLSSPDVKPGQTLKIPPPVE